MPQSKDRTQELYDVAIIGGGLAGLVAAWHLRPLRCAVLEAEGRVGGRIHSINGLRGVMNLGAHMVPSPDSLVGKIVVDLGLDTRPLPRSLFRLRHNNRFHMALPPAALPFVLRLSGRDRLAFARLGTKLRLGAWRSMRASKAVARSSLTEQRMRMLEFEGERSLADYVGQLPPNVDVLFRTLTERNGADPSEMSAGHGLRSFANVWGKGAPGLNLVGGTGILPAALARALGDAILVDHSVTGVRTEIGAGDDRPLVRVDFRAARGKGMLRARACVMATPAPITRLLAPELPRDTVAALSAVRYGSFLTLGVTLDPGGPLPWRDTYAVATPGLGFSVLFNHDTMLEEFGEVGAGAVMLFRGAAGATHEMAQRDEVIVERWISDLETAFPQSRGRIRDVRLARWDRGAPFAFPGRARHQPSLEARTAPFALAGDYLDFPNMEAAAQSGALAAQRVRRWLGAANN